MLRIKKISNNKVTQVEEEISPKKDPAIKLSYLSPEGTKNEKVTVVNKQ